LFTHQKFYFIYSCIHTYMSSTTTIRISHQTKELLNGLKHHKKESYEDVIGRLAAMAGDDEPLSDEEIEDMKASLDDIRAGRVRTLKSIRNELGI
jgi:predicted CopG family antitoxin